MVHNVEIVSGEHQRNSVIHTHDPFSPKPLSHPGCHITLSNFPVLYSRSLLVIHLKYSSVYMSI